MKQRARIWQNSIRFAVAVFAVVFAYVTVADILPYVRELQIRRALNENMHWSIQTFNPGWVPDSLVGRLKIWDRVYSVNFDEDSTPSDAELLSKLSSLRKLNAIRIEGSQFTDAHLNQFGQIPQLKQLTIDRAGITDDGLAAMAGLKNLEWLTFLDMHFTDHGLNHLKHLKHLKCLFVTHRRDELSPFHTRAWQLPSADGIPISHRFGDEGLAALQDLTELCQLTLDRTTVTDTGLKYLSRLTKLRCLKIQTSPLLTGTGFEHLAKMTHLESLELDDTSIEDSALAHLCELKSLTSLHLNNTKITDAGLVHLERLPNLMSLSLSGTSVTDEGMVHLKKLSALECLDLSQTNLTDAGLQQLAGHPNVIELKVSETHVTDAGVVHLQQIHRLSKLDLTGTRVTEEGMWRLKELPNLCKVVLDDLRTFDPRRISNGSITYAFGRSGFHRDFQIRRWANYGKDRTNRLLHVIRSRQ